MQGEVQLLVLREALPQILVSLALEHAFDRIFSEQGRALARTYVFADNRVDRYFSHLTSSS
jgi:pyrroloquinoline quinone (PQQ) biosynthesis protein C